MHPLLRLALALVLLAGLASACSEDAAVQLATDVAVDLGADAACVDAVESMVRASVSVSDQLVDGQDEDLASMLDALGSFVAAAPEEIRPDAQALFDGWAALADAAGADDADAQAVAEAFLDGPEADAANRAIGDWFTVHCTPDDAGTTSTSLR